MRAAPLQGAVESPGGERPGCSGKCPRQAGHGCPPRRGEGRRQEEEAGRRPQLLSRALRPRTRGRVAASFKAAAWEEGRKEGGRDGNPGGGAASRAAEPAGAGAARARPRLFLLFSTGVVLRDGTGRKPAPPTFQVTAGHPARSQLRPESPLPAHSSTLRPAFQCQRWASAPAATGCRSRRRRNRSRRPRLPWFPTPRTNGRREDRPAPGRDLQEGGCAREPRSPASPLSCSGRLGAAPGEVSHGSGPLKHGL